MFQKIDIWFSIWANWRLCFFSVQNNMPCDLLKTWNFTFSKLSNISIKCLSRSVTISWPVRTWPKKSVNWATKLPNSLETKNAASRKCFVGFSKCRVDHASKCWAKLLAPCFFYVLMHCFSIIKQRKSFHPLYSFCHQWKMQIPAGFQWVEHCLLPMSLTSALSSRANCCALV